MSNASLAGCDEDEEVGESVDPSYEPTHEEVEVPEPVDQIKQLQSEAKAFTSTIPQVSVVTPPPPPPAAQAGRGKRPSPVQDVQGKRNLLTLFFS